MRERPHYAERPSGALPRPAPRTPRLSARHTLARKPLGAQDAPHNSGPTPSTMKTPTMRPTLGPALLAAACSAMLNAAQAQPASDEEELAQIYGDKSTVSIATGAPQALRRAPAVATVITAQDIAAMGAADLDTVLELSLIHI